MYGFCTRMKLAGSSPRSSRSRFVNRTLSPVFVEWSSIRIDSSGTPRLRAIRANFRASGSSHIPRVRFPSPPETNEERREPLEEELSPALGDPEIVAPLDENHVGGSDLVVQMKVVPEDSREAIDFGREALAAPSSRRIWRRRSKSRRVTTPRRALLLRPPASMRSSDPRRARTFSASSSGEIASSTASRLIKSKAVNRPQEERSRAPDGLETQHPRELSPPRRRESR